MMPFGLASAGATESVLRRRCSLVIPAQASEIFAVLRDPVRHAEFDASGMVGGPETSGLLSRVGQVFTMNMTYRSGDRVEHYQSDNHITVFEPGSFARRGWVIGWATATHGGPPLGWTWRYDLTEADTGTTVSVTYDWSETPAKNIERFGVPLVNADGLASSLRLLSAVCADYGSSRRRS